jgi:hypothetical protein
MWPSSPRENEKIRINECALCVATAKQNLRRTHTTRTSLLTNAPGVVVTFLCDREGGIFSLGKFGSEDAVVKISRSTAHQQSTIATAAHWLLQYGTIAPRKTLTGPLDWHTIPSDATYYLSYFETQCG